MKYSKEVEKHRCSIEYIYFYLSRVTIILTLNFEMRSIFSQVFQIIYYSWCRICKLTMEVLILLLLYVLTGYIEVTCAAFPVLGVNTSWVFQVWGKKGPNPIYSVYKKYILLTQKYSSNPTLWLGFIFLSKFKLKRKVDKILKH